MLNWRLMVVPTNWVIVFLMVFIGMMVLNLILHPYHSSADKNAA